MKLKANDLASHLKTNLAPCYLVSGDEHLLVGEALDAIRETARGKGFLTRDLHVAETGFDWTRLRASGANLSLFAERRMVELRLPTGKPGRAGADAIVDLVAQCGPDLIFIVGSAKLDRGGQASKWVKAIDAAGVSLQVWPVDARELPNWIAQRMRATGLQPDNAAVRLIADRVEGNLLAASQEIEKLRLLFGSGEISGAELSQAVANSSRYDAFKLVDAVLKGDARRAVTMLTGLKAEGVEPVIIAWALTRELRTLANISEAVAAGGNLGSAMQRFGIWRNRQGLVRSCIARHRDGDFRNLLRTAARLDMAAKGQIRADPWQLAIDILLGLALGQRRAA